jgi:hypothetical protein
MVRTFLKVYHCACPCVPEGTYECLFISLFYLCLFISRFIFKIQTSLLNTTSYHERNLNHYWFTPSVQDTQRKHDISDDKQNCGQVFFYGRAAASLRSEACRFTLRPRRTD